jgi:hypothetical protein
MLPFIRLQDGVIRPWQTNHYFVLGNVRTYFTRPQMLSADSTLPKAGIPVNLMPLLMIQNSCRSE